MVQLGTSDLGGNSSNF